MQQFKIDKIMNKILFFFLFFAIQLQAQINTNITELSDTIPKLQELGSKVGAAAYDEKNYTGITNSQLPALNQAADDLKAVIPVDKVPGFKVFDYGTYNIVNNMKEPEKRNDAVFAEMENFIKTKYNCQNYLLIARYISPYNGKVTFKTKLVLPTTGNKPNANDTTKVANKGGDFSFTQDELLEINAGILSSCYSTENNATQMAGDSKPTINGITEALRQLTPKVLYTLKSEDIPLDNIVSTAPKNFYVIAPEGNVYKVGMYLQKETFTFNLNTGIIEKYCDNINSFGKGFCINWTQADLVHFEKLSNPVEIGDAYNVIFLKRKAGSNCLIEMHKVNWTAFEKTNYPSNLQNLPSVLLKTLNDCDKNGISDKKKEELQNYLIASGATNTEIRINRKGNPNTEAVITANSLNATKGSKKNYG